MQNANFNENNINEFLINLSLILSGNNNNEKEQYLNSFIEYLSLIFQSDNKIKYLFDTLEFLIFQNNDNKIIINTKILVLYPIIFDFNPKLSYKYITNFLNVLQKCSIENDIQFLSYLFSEIINIYFKDDNTCYNNNNDINNITSSIFMNKNSKEQLYTKLLTYCINLIENNSDGVGVKIEEEKNTEKNEHLLGCIFLSILIDKFNSINNDKIINNIWNILSYFFNKKNFNYVYDILYCTLKLIIVAQEKFKIYCNICLFTILDYLTDDNWMIRKTSLEIIFFLTKYCKKEIISVKENIIEFLNVLKDDQIPQVKDTCIQTLNFIDEKDSNQVNNYLNLENNNNEENIHFDNNCNYNKESETNTNTTTNNINNSNNINSIGHTVNISILDSENEKNNSKENTTIFTTTNKINISNNSNNEKNISYNKNYNENNKNIKMNNNEEIYNRSTNCIKNNKSISNVSDDNEYKISYLKYRNYSCDNNSNIIYNNKTSETNIYQNTDLPIYKSKKRINLSIKKDLYNNNKNLNYINFIKNNQKEKNDLSISKLTYTVIQNNNISINKEKTDDSFHILRHKKNKFRNFLDISASNSVKNTQKSKICIHKKYISTLKTSNKNNIHNSAINIHNYKHNKDKNNTTSNNSLEHKHIKINSNISSNAKNENKKDKKIIKENDHTIKEKEKCNNQKIKEKDNMKSKKNTKDIIKNKSINNKTSTNNKCKKTLDNNKSYLNFQKKFEKKMNNKNSLLNQRRPKKLENNYNYNNNIKNEKKICNHFTKKSLNNNKLKNEKTISNLEINPKINLLPLFSEENITNNKNNNKDINNNNINNKDINNNNINNNININLNNSETNDINNQNNPNDIRLITEQLNTLYQGQNMLIKIINNLKDKVDDNYKNINERLITFEGNKTINANIKKKLNNKNYDDIKIELIKQKYNETRFNDALLESIQNDVYLFKLLSLVKAEDLNNINVILIEDIISRLSLKLTSILKNNNRIYLGVILSFINLVVNSKIKLKIVTKLNLEDSLNYIRNDYKYFQISDVDLKLIENIIKLIKN